ncbi:phosphatase PAP2 family protein [Rhizobium sp. BE258]|uniref:phosphatase PAP2 family protein n=1 Tax=Rhizobium sp. BE258 TaxID=2817722 RepID=UPI000DD530B9
MVLALALFTARTRNKPVRLLVIERIWPALGSLAISTGLLTNFWLKSHSGRPRPIQTNLFGGSLEFEPAGSFLGACVRNCSFVSGEASAAGWLACLIFIVPAKHRALAAPPILCASIATVYLRVGFGAHYASDAILGWLLSVVVFAGFLAVAEWSAVLRRTD